MVVPVVGRLSYDSDHVFDLALECEIVTDWHKQQRAIVARLDILLFDRFAQPVRHTGRTTANCNPSGCVSIRFQTAHSLNASHDFGHGEAVAFTLRIGALLRIQHIAAMWWAALTCEDTEA